MLVRGPGSCGAKPRHACADRSQALRSASLWRAWASESRSLRALQQKIHPEPILYSLRALQQRQMATRKTIQPTECCLTRVQGPSYQRAPSLTPRPHSAFSIFHLTTGEYSGQSPPPPPYVCMWRRPRRKPKGVAALPADVGVAGEDVPLDTVVCVLCMSETPILKRARTTAEGEHPWARSSGISPRPPIPPQACGVSGGAFATTTRVSLSTCWCSCTCRSCCLAACCCSCWPLTCSCAPELRRSACCARRRGRSRRAGRAADCAWRS